jgi:hypothetical protein
MQDTEQIDLKVLEQLLQQEMRAAESASLAQAQQQQPAAANGGFNPQMIAAIQHQMSLPLSYQQAHPQQPQRDNRTLWVAGIAGAFTSLTVLGLAAIVSGSLAGNRGTAELNTAVIALSETAQAVSESTKRPNVTCISFNCGGLQRQAEQVESSRSSGPMPTPDLYQSGFSEASAQAASVYQGWSPEMLAQEVQRLHQAKSTPGYTSDQLGRIDAYLQYLGG